MEREFRIDFGEELFSDLRHRIESVRMPDVACAGDWSLGTPSDILKEVLEAWKSSYDWKSLQDYLNGFPQYLCTIDGVEIHYFHIQSGCPSAPAILMAHGWPDSFLRYSKTFPLLKNYNLIVPSIPGFGFSGLPAKGWINNAETAEIWHRLMTQELGYAQYVATGGDMGRGVLFYLAANYPEEVLGLYLTDVGSAASIMSSPDNLLSTEELDYKRTMREWLRREGVYIGIQGSKPYSLGYGLSDSPAAMAGWMLEKYHDWSDWERFRRDDLLNNLTLYWMTRCAPSSITAYYGNSFTLPPLNPVSVPVGIARFPKDILPVPKAWIERNYNLVHFTEMRHGGHFTAMEEPEAFSEDITLFINKVLQRM